MFLVYFSNENKWDYLVERIFISIMMSNSFISMIVSLVDIIIVVYKKVKA